MTLKIYNTINGETEYFQPYEKEKAGLYACGPTVYDHAHIGHARATVSFDVLVRHLKKTGYEVNYVRNFTDIDDKIINRARERNINWQDLAAEMIKSFSQDMESLGCLTPTHSPKATEYIKYMVEDIEELVKKNFAYIIDNDVYFNVNNFKDYGRLSGRDTESQEAGARVNVDERKRHPADFALWKSAKENEPSWPSPWGNGRPGWHIECSTMSFRLLGSRFDIHGGGQDLIFPHHENELAQSQALGRSLAKYWVHNGFVNINDEKMSKSLNNFFTVKEVLKQCTAEVLRFFLVSKHYRSPIDFSKKALKEAEKALERIYRALEQADKFLGTEDLAFNLKLTQEYKELFIQALDEDLNTAKAIGIAFDAVRDLNKAISKQNIDETAAYYTALLYMGEHLNLWQNQPSDFFNSLKELEKGEKEISNLEIEKYILKRNQARQEKNWAKADEIRNLLSAKGVILEDKDGQTTWKYA